MLNNWLILDDGTAEGIAVNLDFGMKVIYGGNFGTPKPLNVYMYHGIQGSATISGSTTCLIFASANLALAAYNRILTTMKTLGFVGKDLRTAEATITSITPSTAVHAVATPIAVVGTGFSADGVITIATAATRAAGTAGLACTVTFTDSTSISFIPNPAAPADTYIVEYTDPRGNAAVASTSLVLT